MGDETKIIPDPPPATPTDVDVFPDPPPSDPFDVPIYPDGPPAKPTDVNVYLDEGPGVPFGVPTFPDGPPVEPFDVATFPDLPPIEPSDVVIFPDPSPADPFDVQVQFDDPPADATQPIPYVGPEAPALSTLPDTKVAIEQELINRKQEVSTSEPPLSTHIDTKAAINAELERQFKSSTPGEPPLTSLKPQPTVEDIVAQIALTDQTLANGLKYQLNLGSDPSIPSTIIGINPLAIFNLFKNITSDITRVTKFMAEQTMLAAMNPEVARVFNPFYFAQMLLPGTAGFAHATVDTLGKTMVEVAQVKNDIIELRALSGDTPGSDQNMYSENSPYTETQSYTVDSLVDAAIDGPNGSPTKKDADSLTRFDVASQFTSDNKFDAGAVFRVRAHANNVRSTHMKLYRSAAIDGIIRVGIRGENPDGSKNSRTQNPADGPNGIDDDDARVPISFTDLRQLPDNHYRSVYFQPMNLTISENLTPQINEQTTFGRVDSAVTYIGTARSFSVSFEIHVFAPEDLQVLHSKLNHLRSMVYPTYGADGLMRTGPVSRMRIGDLVRTDLGGIAGVIKNLSFDFNEALWELKRGLKVPRSVSVSLEFLALHEGPVGQLNGEFGVLKLPTGGFVGHDETQSGDAQSTVGEVIPDKFMRMPRSS